MFLFDTCKRLKIRPLLIVAVVSLLCQFFGIESITARAQTAKPLIKLELRAEKLSANISNVPLSEVLTQLGKELGIRIYLRGELNSPSNVSFSAVPLTEAIRLLTVGHSLVIMYRPDNIQEVQDSLSRITGIWVFENKGAPASNTVGRSSAEEVNDSPSAEPEPEPVASNRTELVDQDKDSKDDTELGTWSRILRRNEDPETREKALRVLEQIGTEKAVSTIAELLKDDSASMRNLVVDSLSRIQSEQATLILGQIVFGDRDPEVRLAAVQALGYKYGEASVAFLIAATKDKDDRVSKAARIALGQE